MSRYFYPDVDDYLVERMIREYGSRWSDEEVEMLSIMASNIGDIDPMQCLAVDVACGKGRLIPWIRDALCSSGEVVALDLDFSRLVEALSERDSSADLVLANAESIPLRSEEVDFVLCSHLIQHVTRRACHRILEEMHRILKPGGYALILTTHSEREHEYYMIAKEDGVEIVDAETFDLYASNPHRYMLPVRKFDLRNLLSTLENLGFEVVKVVFYHTRHLYFNLFKNVEELNKLGYEARRYAIDVAILVRKAHPPRSSMSSSVYMNRK